METDIDNQVNSVKSSGKLMREGCFFIAISIKYQVKINSCSYCLSVKKNPDCPGCIVKNSDPYVTSDTL